MASTYSPLKIELITTGEQSATWGTTTNINLGTAIEEAITGSADVTFASNNITLSWTDTNGSQSARNLRLRLIGATGGSARTLIVPAIEKFYIVLNECADTITIKNSTGTGVAIPTTMTAIVYNDGTNISSASIYSTSIVTPLLAATDASFVNPLPITSGGTGATTATGTGSIVRQTSPILVTPQLGTPVSGALTNCTGLPLSTGTTGTLGVSNGGTGVTTSTGSGANVLNTSPTLVTPVLGTPSSGTLTSCTGLPLSTGITGTLGVSNGGTGVTTSTGSGANVLATSPTLVTPLLGTPTSGNLTNCTGLPISTGVSGLATGAATFLTTPSSANLAAMLTDETGTGAIVFANSPTLVTPALGTPSALVGTNITGTAASLTVGNATNATNSTTQVAGTNNTTIATTAFVQTEIGTLGTMASQDASAVAITGGTITGLSSALPVASGGTGVTTSTGSGANVLGTSPVLTTPTINSAQVSTVSGTAPLFMCRAWVNFNGTGTVAIRASGNVASITKNGTGDYTITFTTALPDANYVWSASGCDRTNTATNNETPTFKTTSAYQVAASLRIKSYYNLRPTGTNYDNGVADLELITVAIFR